LINFYHIASKFGQVRNRTEIASETVARYETIVRMLSHLGMHPKVAIHKVP